MSTNIQETINRLRELDQKASPAPWVPRTGYTAGGLVSLDISAAMQAPPVLMRVWADLTQRDREVEPQNDFTLIIETRNAIPELLAEIDRLTAENAQLLDAVAKAWAEGYLDKEAEASEAMIERGLRERAKNPYQEDRK